MKKETYKKIILLIYVIFGLYFVNYPFQWVKIPEFILGFEKWIILVGGILIIYGAVNYFKVGRNYIG